MNRKLAVFAFLAVTVFAGGLLVNRHVMANSESGIARTPVVVELFTSQGCSSCPPADKLLRALADQPIDGVEIIPLSWHVDYWNRLGWTDPYSSETATARQQAYARDLSARGLYTPQMVVDGRAEFVGSDRSRAHGVIKNAGNQKKYPLELTLEKTGEIVSVKASADIGVDTTAWNVLAILAENEISTDVKRGENSGRELHHTAVVRDSVAMKQRASAEWNGALTIPDDSNALAVVVLAQDARGRTVAVARVEIAN